MRGGVSLQKIKLMARKNSVTGFRNADQTSCPDAWVRYLDTVSALDVVQQWKARTFALLDARAGQQLLDVGCGLGDDVRTLAQRVGRTGRVVGVDTSTTMIEEARKRTAGQPLPVEYYVGDAQRLDFPDETFDGCRAERVFVHLAHPQAALTELVRVTRSGGRIVVGDPDFDSFLVDGGERELARRLMHFATDRMARNGWMGRQLWALCCGRRLVQDPRHG